MRGSFGLILVVAAVMSIGFGVGLAPDENVAGGIIFLLLFGGIAGIIAGLVLIYVASYDEGKGDGSDEGFRKGTFSLADEKHLDLGVVYEVRGSTECGRSFGVLLMSQDGNVFACKMKQVPLSRFMASKDSEGMFYNPVQSLPDGEKVAEDAAEDDVD